MDIDAAILAFLGFIGGYWIGQNLGYRYGYDKGHGDGYREASEKHSPYATPAQRNYIVRLMADDDDFDPHDPTLTKSAASAIIDALMEVRDCPEDDDEWERARWATIDEDDDDWAARILDDELDEDDERDS